MKLPRSLLTLFTALALPLSTASAVNWNELIDGDISDDGDFPTFIDFSDEHNLIEGTMGFDGVNLDRDIWTFTIQPGYHLTAINLVTYSAPASGIESFMALAGGTSIDLGDPSLHLSNGLWTEQLDGLGNTFTPMLDILDAGPQFGGLGFDGPLGPGEYTFWIQETTDQIQYCIDFVVVPIPEPGSALLLGAASLLCLQRRRK